MQLKDLVGNRTLSGIDLDEVRGGYNKEDWCQIIRFIIDGVTYEAQEDPSDGYRSYLDELKIVNTPVKNSFPAQEVICSMKEDSDHSRNDTLIVFDALTNGMVLELGTDNLDDYYPICVINWTPENLAINQKK